MQGSWRDRMVTAPLWVIFLWSAVFFGVALYLTPGGGPRWLVGAVGSGMLFGVSMTAYVAVMRRRDQQAAGPGGIPDRAAVGRALRTGEAPADRALDQPLLGLTQRRRRQFRWASKVNPWLFGTLAVVGVASAIGSHDLPSLAYPVILLAFLLHARGTTNRSMARLDQLESELRARSGK